MTKREVWNEVVGLLGWLALFVVGCLLVVGCGGATVTGPEHGREAVSNAPTPVASPAAQLALEPAGVVVEFGPGAGWSVLNRNGFRSEFWAYVTDFDDQGLARAVRHGVVEDGDRFEGSFEARCVQLDITQEETRAGGPGGHPIAAAYYDERGRQVRQITPAIRAACAPPAPQPTPEPVPETCCYRVRAEAPRLMCEATPGGPLGGLRRGEWLEGEAAMGAGPHCRYPVPGVHADLGGHFSLIPEMSGRGCKDG